MSLTPSQSQMVPMEVLHQWLRMHKYVPLLFQPQGGVPDMKTNEEHFRGLVRVLLEKNIVRVHLLHLYP